MNIKYAFLTSLKVFITFSILLGIIYPLGITAIAQITMRCTANGSLIKDNGKIVGSKLIGQEFTAPEYFYSRPSSAGYNAADSGGSNLGPSSKKLMSSVADRVKQVKAENNIKSKTVPADMVLTSASGLDPHISLENALLQLPRVAKARKISEDKIKKLISKNTDSDFIGIWGQSGINVLKLNLALDSLTGK